MNANIKSKKLQAVEQYNPLRKTNGQRWHRAFKNYETDLYIIEWGYEGTNADLQEEFESLAELRSAMGDLRKWVFTNWE